MGLQKFIRCYKRCPLLGDSSKRIVTFETKHFVCYSRHVHYLGCPLLGGFTVTWREWGWGRILLKLDIQGQGGGRILDVDGQGGVKIG